MIRAVAPQVVVSPEQVARKSVYLAHADRGQHVSVVGPDKLSAMISLCRDGFDHVECARRSTSTYADEASDVLLVSGLMSAEDLANLLRRTCRLLRDGGVLVVQLQRPADDRIVRSVLRAMGLEARATLIDVSAGCLVTRTVSRAAPALRKAS